jgi:hypothetical protein
VEGNQENQTDHQILSTTWGTTRNLGKKRRWKSSRLRRTLSTRLSTPSLRKYPRRRRRRPYPTPGNPLPPIKRLKRSEAQEVNMCGRQNKVAVSTRLCLVLVLVIYFRKRLACVTSSERVFSYRRVESLNGYNSKQVSNTHLQSINKSIMTAFM